MFVKVYQYHIRKDKENEFFTIQEKVFDLYRKHIDVQITYLQSKTDETKWLEIATYKTEAEYIQRIHQINEEEEIQRLFSAFQSLLVVGKQEISEEHFALKKRLFSSAT